MANYNRKPGELPFDRKTKMNITVHVDVDTHKKLKHLSIDLGKSLERLFLEAVADLLVKHERWVLTIPNCPYRMDGDEGV